ncbi:Peptidase family M28 [Bradyrhizobium erythrophlei]|uniref:Peptidase family M28 n=2 Tax=Bradyrhizobium erythrophlei TaxID=1437360 RepID=A0A1M5PS03_9BRAD|nr:Peptidase family M28 [Bradyrhizobium erythrophlei]
MLSFRRPAGSKTEAAFIERFLTPLGVKKDKFGNHILVVGDENPSILWSSHTDSVHTKHGHQKVEFDGKFIRLPAKSRSNCLGADCAAGVWIMMEMIQAKVPGLYVFHAAEEIGCIGSRGIATKQPDFLANIKAAIAFDRRGTSSVITHQGSRCCSDAFGNSMAAQLPERFKLDPTGVLTDTKIYMKIVPECSNISVGYYHEHQPEEKLDVDHLIELRDHMVKIDASKFVIERDPKLMPPAPKKTGLGQLSFLQSKREPRDTYDLVYWHPRKIVKLLEAGGINFEQLRFYIDQSDDSSFEFEGEDQSPLVA